MYSLRAPRVFSDASGEILTNSIIYLSSKITFFIYLPRCLNNKCVNLRLISRHNLATRFTRHTATRNIKQHFSHNRPLRKNVQGSVMNTILFFFLCRVSLTCNGNFFISTVSPLFTKLHRNNGHLCCFYRLYVQNRDIFHER